MLAGAAHKFLRRYGVAVGRRPVFFLNSDEAYESVFAYAAAGISSGAVVDVRAASPGAERARALGVRGHRQGDGRTRCAAASAVRAVRVAHGRRSARARKLEADCLLMSGGYTPNIALASQLRAELHWREDIAAFTAALSPASSARWPARRAAYSDWRRRLATGK